MNKKLLVLAVSSALTGTSALADTVNVNVYGKLYPQYMQSSAHGATAPGTTGLSTLAPAATITGADTISRHEVNSQNSYVGFKGDADVGRGMKGWFQVEQTLEFDTGTGQWASRNSAAGLSGGFGNIFLGRWDTVYKQLGDPVSFLGLSSGNFVSNSNVLSIVGFGVNRQSRFHERQNNWVEYDTPSFGGFQALLGYSPAEDKTTGLNKNLQSLGVKWEGGPLYFALAQERHEDYFAGSRALAGSTLVNSTTGNGPRSKDTATRFSFKVSLPSGTEIGTDLARMEYKESGQTANGRFEKYTHNAWAVTVLQKLGNTQIAGSYVRSDKGTCSLSGGVACDTAGLEGTMYNLGAKYDFSKRVGVFGLLSKITNGAAANFSNLSNAVAPGADPKAIAAGVVVSF